MHRILEDGAAADDLRDYPVARVDREASVLEASKLMRDSGATEVLVTDDASGRLLGIGVLTANDIIRWVVAAGLDPAVMTAGDIAWRGAPSRIQKLHQAPLGEASGRGGRPIPGRTRAIRPAGAIRVPRRVVELARMG